MAIGLSLSLLSFSLSVAGLCLFLAGSFCVLYAAKRNWSLSWNGMAEKFGKPVWRFLMLRANWAWSRSTITMVSGLFLAFTMGYLTGKANHYSNIRTYHDVPVTRVYGPYRYDMLIGLSTYKITVCSDGPSPNWQAGETLTDITWEVMSGCKRVYGPDVNFRELTDETTGKLILKEIANATQRP
jgi:hypothetical protein